MILPESKVLGLSLVEKNIITHEQMGIALKKQEGTGKDFQAVLLDLGFIDDEAVILPVLAQEMGVDYVRLRDIEIPGEVIKKIPAQFVIHYQVIPLGTANDALTVATTRPWDIHLLDEIGLVVNARLKPVLSGQKEILEAIRRYYGIGAETIEEMKRMMGTAQPVASAAPLVTNIEETQSEASISKFFNQILLEAYRDRATDIHIEPFEGGLQVRYRVDGVLYDAGVPADIKHFREAIVSRIKILSNLNIAEKRMPQDGRFKVHVGDSDSFDGLSPQGGAAQIPFELNRRVDLDLRVSFIPTPYGESVVLRILNSARLYNLGELGLSEREKSLLEGLIRKPHGIIFLTGPTGSGKTTTLYSCLAHINTQEKKIITIEDPIEYQLKGIIQIQVNPSIGLSFAHGLRSMLRHDPDIMMVGEVRDKETAQIAVQIALTGHLIFSTLHTNDAASGITRLLDMGVEPYLITSTVEGFIAQRLIRVICLKCKGPVRVTAEMIRDFGSGADIFSQRDVYEGKGCKACNFTGFSGREAIYEFFIFNEAIRQLILDRASASRLKEKAFEYGMKTLRQAGWEKVMRGITTIQEVLRVTQEEES
jgi:type II secretory ATPase GspE/PulE/Tfp pilus assembly ATPase PilB-like protein